MTACFVDKLTNSMKKKCFTIIKGLTIIASGYGTQALES